jgi:hypothetical protein
MQAPATKALSTTVNSRRDVLGGFGWSPLHFLGFLRVIRSIFREKQMVFDGVMGGARW